MRINPATTRRLALGLSALLFLVIYPLLNAFAWNHLPHFARANGSDFSQYYSGALAVKVGLRDHLYPQPDEGIYSNPPTFRPHFDTPLFDPTADASRTGNWAFYPQVAQPGTSKVSEQLTAEYPLLQDSWHYISPPPLALLLSPLALFEFQTACRLIWFPLMCASLFGISFFSAKICRLIYKRQSHIEAVAALLPVFPALLGSSQSTTLAVGNASPLLGFLITLVAYAFLTNRQILLGLCIIPLILFKGIGIAWCPLLLIGGIKWRSLGVMAFLTLLLNAITLHLGGLAVYETFFKEILPKMSTPVGNGIKGILMELFGVDTGIWITLAYLGFLLALYILHFKAIRRGTDPGLASLMVVIASIAWLNLFNNVVWPNYFMLYLFLPFSPWIFRETSMMRGRTRILMGLLIFSVILCWMDFIFVIRQSVLVELLIERNLYSSELDLLRKIISAITYYGIPIAVSVVVLALSIKRLMADSFASPPSKGMLSLKMISS